MSKKNQRNESLAAKRERLQKQEAIHRQSARALEERECQREEAFESAVKLSRGLTVSWTLVTFALIAVASFLWREVSVPGFMSITGVWWTLAVLSVLSVVSSLVRLPEPLGAVIALRRWPSIEALIVASEPQITGYADTGQVYQPQATYEFEVGGSRYRRDFALKSWSFNSRGWAEDICSEHPPGSSITVRYDPRQPNASLVPGVEKTGRFPTLHIAMLLFWIGVLGMVIAA
jgi:uncharacterized protein (DUF983 family)